MLIRNIDLKGFRNYSSAYTDFDPGINLITGYNAQGKTNLLDALFYLTGAKSFRTRKDSDLIKFGEEAAFINSSINTCGRDINIEINLKRSGKKQIFMNNVRKKTASELSGKLCAILFCPEDLEIIKGSAAERRRFIDLAICQLRPKYALALSEFNRSYEHKTRILKDYREKPDLLNVLDEFNIKLAKAGTELIFYRASWCAKLAESAARIHREISGCGESLRIKYKTVSTIEDPKGLKPSEIYACLLEHQKSHTQAELDSGQCLSGAHKDDLLIEINEQSAREFASQGQVRTCALSLKLAEREISCEDKGEYPILLLDDVLSELDADRQDFMLNKIYGGQVFITCCESKDIEKKTGGRILTVSGGSFVK